MTLTQFIKSKGSQEKAAHAIGVTVGMVNRWVNKKHKPRGLTLRRLNELGIKT